MLSARAWRFLVFLCTCLVQFLVSIVSLTVCTCKLCNFLHVGVRFAVGTAYSPLKHTSSSLFVLLMCYLYALSLFISFMFRACSLCVLLAGRSHFTSYLFLYKFATCSWVPSLGLAIILTSLYGLFDYLCFVFTSSFLLISSLHFS